MGPTYPEPARFEPRAWAGTRIGMRFMLIGLAVAALLFVISGGHLLFLPLFFVLPLFGGALGGSRRRQRRF